METEPGAPPFENSGMVYKTRQTALQAREKLGSETLYIPHGVPEQGYFHCEDIGRKEVIR